jgi:hypothetical protein
VTLGDLRRSCECGRWPLAKLQTKKRLCYVLASLVLRCFSGRLTAQPATLPDILLIVSRCCATDLYISPKTGAMSKSSSLLRFLRAV